MCVCVSGRIFYIISVIIIIRIKHAAGEKRANDIYLFIYIYNNNNIITYNTSIGGTFLQMDALYVYIYMRMCVRYIYIIPIYYIHAKPVFRKPIMIFLV